MKFMSWRIAAAAALMAAATICRCAPSQAGEALGAKVLEETCSRCHAALPSGGFERISEERKTPEGWELTISRMERFDHVTVSAAQEAAVVKWLADRQGLAPAEAAPFRYALERRPVVESPDDTDLAGMCASCHTYARIGLERRDKAEWLKLANMHLGQWPNIEYVATSRDREWWKLASTEIPAKLGAKWPLETKAWSEWKTHRHANLAGSWRVAGHRAGKGDYAGDLVIRPNGDDHYSITYKITYSDGTKSFGKGSAIVYTGYEWRGTVRLGKEKIHEVYALSADGNRLSGRWFRDGQDGIGADVVAVRGVDAIAGVEPRFIRSGQPSKLTIIGSGLKGTVQLGAGIVVDKVLSATPGAVTILATAAKDTPPGERAVAVGKAQSASALVVYDRVKAVEVEPGIAVARMGGNGGPIAPALCQFEAVAYTKTADGAPLRIGAMPAKWEVANFDETAAKDRDASFGGHIDRNGLFTPGLAGPNPKRGGYDNAANLSVKATMAEGGAAVEGAAHLYVAPQRWNDAPIR